MLRRKRNSATLPLQGNRKINSARRLRDSSTIWPNSVAFHGRRWQRSASPRSPRSRPARTTRSRCATRWSDSSRSRHPAREPIRASFAATTRNNGRNSNRCPTCSTPTATSSACTVAGSWKERWCLSREMSKPLVRPLMLRPNWSAYSTTFFGGSRSRRRAPRNWRRSRPAFADCSAMR